ncbi:hypothetical protein M9H77_00708 [Catharanthus roseus]|uniref:Uncharacterized protein n=1 Tax=Catharanthus roseus TaxID=4058 RepID=A0ACC0C3V5_CATRO|nr:hypothetical protein M9H77_00708 [Catharanthus roseus]
MKGASIMRRLIASTPLIVSRSSYSSSLMETVLLSSAAATASYSTLILSEEMRRPLFHWEICPRISTIPYSGLAINHRDFSSSSASGHSKMIAVETEKELNDSLLRAEGKFISPIIGQLSEKYPHVATYKIDIDKEGLASALSKLNITAVPTVYFFKDGKKASMVVGADPNRLCATMEDLHHSNSGWNYGNENKRRKEKCPP